MLYTKTEMVTKVARWIQKTGDSNFNTKISDWLLGRYDHLCKRYPWKHMIRVEETGIVTVSGNKFLVLPKRAGQILMISERTNKEILNGRLTRDFWERNTSDMDSQSIPEEWAEAGAVASKLALSAADKVQVLSNNASDTSAFTVRIMGIVGGNEVSETITMNGTTAVDSVNTYDSGTFLTAIGKSGGTWSGVVTVREKIDTTKTLATLDVTESAVLYRRIRMFYVPNAAITMAVYYVKEPRQLMNDLDVPEFDCCEYLIRGAYADALMEQKNYAKAQFQEQLAERALNALLSREFSDDQIVQAVPLIKQRY